MRTSDWLQAGFILTALTVLLCAPVLGGEVPPDLTKGETKGVDRKQTYNLGATGRFWSRMWVRARRPTAC